MNSIVYIIFSIALTFGNLSVQKSSNKLTIEEVKREIKANKIKYPEIVLKQAILETGWFKCKNCCLNYNNLFGFRLKKCVTRENPYGYIRFNTWQESVAYYKRWQDKFYKGGNYYDFLDHIGYAEGQRYAEAIKSIKP